MSDSLLISSTVLESHNEMAFIITLPIESTSPVGNQIIDAPVLLDCGAEGNFMNPQYAQKNNVHLYPLSHPIIPQNVDGSINLAGKITHFTHIRTKIGKDPYLVWLLVMNIGKHNIILGLPWLQEYNPVINWKKGTMTMPERTRKAYQDHYEEKLHKQNQKIRAMEAVTIRQLEESWEEQKSPEEPEESTEQEDQENEGPQKINLMEFLTQEDEGPQENYELEFLGAEESTTLEIDTMDILEQLEERTGPPTVHIRKTNISMELAAKENLAKQEKQLKEQVPQELHDYLSVFDKKTAEGFPESTPWDHAIDLKLDFVPRDCKVYPLSLPEQQELETFVKDNLTKGYIWPSKSPMASPFFFVNKKDGKLWPCQDYQALNEGTIKNTYPLLHISDLMDKLWGAKYFTKLDIQWGYNNIRIKDGDQWKGAFKTRLGLFEPTVMFFGMCNSPATFQKMMDEMFKDKIHEAWVCKGDCGAELNQILAGGPKLIYYNK